MSLLEQHGKEPKKHQFYTIYLANRVIDLFLNFVFTWIIILPETEKEIAICLTLTIILCRIDFMSNTVSYLLNATKNPTVAPENSINYQSKLYFFVLGILLFKTIAPSTFLASLFMICIWAAIFVGFTIAGNRKIGS
jgi:hypothetical protein